MTTTRTVDAIDRVLPQDENTLLDLVKSLNLAYNDKHDKRIEAYNTLARDILGALGNDADRLLADLCIDPASHEVVGRDQRRRVQVNLLATKFACAHIQHHPGAYAAEGLIRRLRWMMETAGGANESKVVTYQGPLADRYLLPGPTMCLFLLSWHLGVDGVYDFLIELVTGKFDRRVEAGESYSGPLYRAFFRHGPLTRGVYDRVLQQCQERGRLSYELFCDTMMSGPVFDKSRLARTAELPAGASPAYGELYREFGLRFLTEAVDALPDTRLYARASGGGSLHGLHWIARGLDKIGETGYTAKDMRRDDAAGPKAIRHLISKRLDDHETEQQLVGMLQRHDEKTLLLALPYARNSRVGILEALGWDDIAPVQDLIFGIAGGTPYDDGRDIFNGADPSSGVLDRPRWLTVLDAADPKRLDKYLKVIRAWGGMRHNMMLVDALRGEGREKIEKALVKHGQAAIKAYGLLPVESPDELRQRYLRLKTIHKEVAKYGSERQLNSRAAVKAAMCNLAQAAGFADEVRMEWELEADLADSMTGLDDWHEIDQWRVRLALDGVAPAICVERNGKLLKSVPPRVRKTDYYKTLRENQEILREQTRRFRRTLENMMAGGETIDAGLLALLKKHPALRSMLRQLILIDADGGIGIYDDALISRTAVDGTAIDASLPLRIAHVADLYDAGQLSDWQQFIVGKRTVQPFRQAFRELYVLTPAEKSTGARSARFAGQVVDSGVTARLLQSRGWQTGYGNAAWAQKHSDRHGLTANLDFIEPVRFFTEEAQLTIDLVEFRRGRDAVPLTDVDPLLFSETMRDVDLVTSVAQAAGDEAEGRISAEVLMHRWNVLEALLAVIGQGRVTCKDRFACVEGRLATYKIHLASAAIHIEPGNYLCIVPRRSGNDDGLYLPFADTDSKIAEILSKVLLLLNDDQIEDDTIVRQIERAAALAPAHTH